MIASGAQIRAARGFLGWTQEDLAKAAELNIDSVRHWEAQHGERLHHASARGYGPKRIAQALRKAGVVLTFDPPGVEIDPNLYETDIKPPIYQRWEKHWKPNSKRASPGRVRVPHAIRQIPKVW